MKLKVLAGMLVATTAMALTPIDDLNKAIVELLKPVQNKLTSAEVVFTKLEVSDTRALKAGVEVAYSKVGKLTELLLEVNGLSYDATADSRGPRVQFDAGVITELDVILGQDTINELGPIAAEIITDMASGFLEDYGAAAEVEVRKNEEQYDDEGNLISMEIYGRVKVDLERLPEWVPVESVQFKEIEMTLAAGLNGLSAGGYMIMNPDSRLFDADNRGLKELIEQLLSQDKATMTELEQLVTAIDGMVEEAVNEGFQSAPQN